MSANDRPLTISWSRLSDYEVCGERSKLISQGKAGAKNGRIFLPGTVADRCMRKYLELDNPERGHICDPLDELLEHYINVDPEYVIRWMGDPAQDRERVRAKVERVLTSLEPILWDKVLPFGYQAEVRFRVTVGIPYLDGTPTPITLIGGIDILTMTLDGEQNYAVYDLKATEDDSYVRGRTLAQLIFYAIAVKAMFGKYPIETAFITPGCKEKVVPLVINEQHVREMMSRIINYAHGVWKEEYHPKPEIDDGCRRCDVRHACSLWKLPHGKKLSFEEMAARRKK